MHSSENPEWLESKQKARSERRKQERLSQRNPQLKVIDAGKFADQLSKLAVTITNKVEREGPGILTNSPVPTDTGVILRQLTETYNLIRFINSDNMRDGDFGYRCSYSFVILPLIRTMVDGFYNCTALLDQPVRSRSFRISGLYRLREALRADEQDHSADVEWQQYLSLVKQNLENGMRVEGLTDADLDNSANKWPTLGDYLRNGPDSSHKAMLRKLTLGFWKEYSSISHASYDGLVNIFPFVARDKVAHERRDMIDEAAERHRFMHFARAAGLLLCLLTEIQHYFRFDGADIDARLKALWDAMDPIFEVHEFYEFRYKNLLRSS